MSASLTPAVRRKFERREGIIGLIDEVVAIIFCGFIGWIYYLVVPVVLFVAYKSIFVQSPVWITISFILMGLAFSPNPISKTIVKSYVYRCVSRYFETEIVQMEGDDTIENSVDGKHALCLSWHHGVIPFAAISCGALGVTQFGPTAVADVVLHIPFLRTIFGWFGSISSSRHSIKKQLQKTNVILYPGGIAELFMSSDKVEQIYFKKRLGCIKLAIEANSDIIPVYFFGNTHCLTLVNNRFISYISRKLKISLCLFWGRWGLPIPRPTKMVLAVGKRVKLPSVKDKSEITEEMVKKCHDEVMDACKQTFDWGKQFNKEYVNKELIIK